MYYCFLFLFIITVLGIFSLSITSEAHSNGFSTCSPTGLQCGDHSYEILYPFRFPTSPDWCGHPGFELSCKDNTTLTILIGEKDYKVNDINYTSQEIRITDMNFSNGTCPQNSFTNSTFDPSLFSYSELDLNLTLFLNCSATVPVSTYLHNLSCGPSNDSVHHSFYKFQNDMFPSATVDALNSCDAIVYIPIIGTAENELIRNGMSGFLRALYQGFGLTWKVGDGWCRKCEDSHGICGYNMNSPDEPECYCSLSSSLNGECIANTNLQTKEHKKRHAAQIIAIVVGAVSFFVVSLSLVFFLYKHSNVCNYTIFCGNNFLKENQNIEDFLEEYGSVAPKRYTYSQVKSITRAFKEKLGQGGYGTVFKGTHPDGRLVAVKMLNDSRGSGEDFMNEVASIGRTSHVNIVNLLGVCSEGRKRALIYDFMCNGSLEKLLDSEKPKTTLDWEMLYQIAIGIARGLEYLHRGCNTRIVHFDIKPHNILLDEDFCPKISDFGLAKLCPKKESKISIAGARGTIGYIAPEVFSRNFGVVSSKSDVYSYGMMVLEMAGGRKQSSVGAENSSEMYFPHWIYEHLNHNRDLLACVLDAESEETVRKMILVGLWCIQTLPQNRPPMSRVIEMLEGNVSDLQIPPKPHLCCPLGSIAGTTSIQDNCWIDDSSSIHS